MWSSLAMMVLILIDSSFYCGTETSVTPKSSRNKPKRRKLMEVFFILFSQHAPVLRRTSKWLKWPVNMSTWCGRHLNTMEEVQWHTIRLRREKFLARHGPRYFQLISVMSSLALYVIKIFQLITKCKLSELPGFVWKTNRFLKIIHECAAPFWATNEKF